jgi:hypothetical protein
MAKPFSHKWPTKVIKSHELATEGWPLIFGLLVDVIYSASLFLMDVVHSGLIYKHTIFWEKSMSQYYEKIQKYIEVLIEYIGYEYPPEEMEKKVSDAVNNFVHESLMQLIYSPGELIRVPPGTNIEKLEDFVSKVWQKDINSDSVIDDIYNEGLNSDLFMMAEDFVANIQTLRPTFVHSTVRNIERIEAFYNEALLCYGHYNFNAAIALSAATIESVVREEIRKKDDRRLWYLNSKGQRRDRGFGDLIEEAEKLNILGTDELSAARSLNTARINILHRLHSTKPETAHENINRAKKVLIFLYST